MSGILRGVFGRSGGLRGDDFLILMSGRRPRLEGRGNRHASPSGARPRASRRSLRDLLGAGIRAVRWGAVGLAFVLLAGAAQAGSLEAHSPLGRYALNEASCKAKDYFATLEATRLTLPTYGCEDVDYDETENKGGRALFAVKARACSSEEDAKPHRDAFQMTLENGALQFLWKDGTKSAKLVRCSAGARAR